MELDKIDQPWHEMPVVQQQCCAGPFTVYRRSGRPASLASCSVTLTQLQGHANYYRQSVSITLTIAQKVLVADYQQYS